MKHTHLKTQPKLPAQETSSEARNIHSTTRPQQSHIQLRMPRLRRPILRPLAINSLRLHPQLLVHSSLESPQPGEEARARCRLNMMNARVPGRRRRGLSRIDIESRSSELLLRRQRPLRPLRNTRDNLLRLAMLLLHVPDHLSRRRSVGPRKREGRSVEDEVQQPAHEQPTRHCYL